MIIKQDAKVALSVMKEVSDWLNVKRLRFWNSSHFDNGRVLSTSDENLFFAGFVGEHPVAAMILQWSDNVFWPNSVGDSGFIHKFCVKRTHAGTGVSGEFVAWARHEVQAQGRTFLRLTCAGDRLKLCNAYEKLGFNQVDRRKIGRYDIAFYEIAVGRKA